MKTKQPQKSSLNKRLSSYSAIAGSLAFSLNANADIIYTDVNPDSTYNKNNDTLFIDLNNDATNDFYIRLTKTPGTLFTNSLRLTPMGLNQFVGDSVSVSALTQGLPINKTNSWYSNFNQLMARAHYTTGGPATNLYGIWPGSADEYLGLRLRIGVDTIYGWVRLSVGDTVEYITIKDYAFENIPNKPINAGDVQANPVTNVVASDIADNMNASDILLSFNKIANESKVSGYFAIVVKSADAGSFNLDTANAAYAVANGFSIAKTGSNISVSLNASTKDKDGNSLLENVGYKVFVLSIADGSITTVNQISASSNEVFLRKYPLSGTVYLGDNSSKVLDGDIVLFRKTSVAAPAAIAGQTTINSSGDYSFTGVLPGTYILLAIPDTLAYPDAFPTYHNSTIKWFKGTEIVASTDTLTADIIVKVAPADTTGTGIVRGKLLRGDYNGTLKVMGPGDPLGGVDVNLVDKSTSSPVAHSSTTDQNGEFTFNNVPDGNFLLHVDIAGIPIDTNFVLNVNTGTTNKSYVKIKVDSSYISFEDSINNYIVSRNGDFAVKLFPNPSKGNARLNYKLSSSADVEVTIYDFNGKKINVLLNQKQQPAGIYELDLKSNTSDLPTGTYILNIKIAGVLISEKWIEIN